MTSKHVCPIDLRIQDDIQDDIQDLEVDLEVDLEGEFEVDFKQDMEVDLLSSSGQVRSRSRLGPGLVQFTAQI